jgi:hypothetical protein
MESEKNSFGSTTLLDTGPTRDKNVPLSSEDVLAVAYDGSEGPHGGG